jgi:hypothetical protein
MARITAFFWQKVANPHGKAWHTTPRKLTGVSPQREVVMNGNNELRHPKVDEARRLLPMPELMKQLGLGAHVNTYTDARCPLCHRENTFALRENSDGTWWWRCEFGCGEGDEITFLEKHLSSPVSAEQCVTSKWLV